MSDIYRSAKHDQECNALRGRIAELEAEVERQREATRLLVKAGARMSDGIGKFFSSDSGTCVDPMNDARVEWTAALTRIAGGQS